MRDLQYLAITGLLPAGSGLLEVARLAGHCGCHMHYLQAHTQEDWQVVNLIVQGSWSAIAKMENALASWQQKENLKLHFQRLAPAASASAAVGYLLYLSTPEESSVIHKVLAFLAAEPLTVHDIQLECYAARHTRTPMTHMTLRVSLSTQYSISQWRERFMLFCEDLNIDAGMEPDKS